MVVPVGSSHSGKVVTRMRVPRCRSVVVLAAVGSLLVLAAPASAADKPYSLVISNADVTSSTPATLAGGSPGTIRATYTNLTGQQQLGSSDLTVPAGLHVSNATVAPTGTATVVGNVIKLRNLGVSNGQKATVTIQVAPECAAASYTWSAPVTKQANNFSGSPGNNLNLDGAASDLRTIVTGGCGVLRFLAQPQNARVTQTITNRDYDPSGPPVSVEVVDSLGQRITTSTAQISIGFAVNAGGGTLSGTTTKAAVAGVATFSNLSIDNAGYNYSLAASSPGATSATSDPFTIDQVAVVCVEDVDCSGQLALAQTNQGFGGSSTVDVTAVQGPATDIDGGFLLLSVGLGGALDCTGFTEFTAALDVIAADYTALDREKRIVATIDKRVMNAESNNGASFLESCFGAPYTFATKIGTPLEVNTAYVPGPYPAPEYKGLLPDCGGSAQLDDPATPGVSGPIVSNAAAPCVLKRKKTGAGDGIIESLWPSGRAVGISDPRGRY